MKGKYVRAVSEAIMACLNVISQNSSGGSEPKYENCEFRKEKMKKRKEVLRRKINVGCWY
jgi:hypothetical protein